MSIPANVNLLISSFNRSVVNLEDIIGQQTEEAFSKLKIYSKARSSHQTCSIKMSQNLKENDCVEVSFLIKFQA